MSDADEDIRPGGRGMRKGGGGGHRVGRKGRPKGAGKGPVREGGKKPGRWAAALPALAPGEGFFDRYPRFEETSNVASNLPRLNFRHHVIVAQNRALIEGKRVLDIASHDGRFSFAALDAGAAHVTSVEPRAELVANAGESFAHYGVDPARYRLVQSDVYDFLPQMEPGSIDTAMVLGFLYHTPRHYELFAQLHRIGVQTLIVDSQVLRGQAEPVVQLRWEGTEGHGQIWDAERPQVLSAVPSATALELYMQEFGWKPRRVVPTIAIPETGSAYRIGRRVILIGTRD